MRKKWFPNMSYLRRSSTEYFLCGNHRAELYLTKVELSPSSSSSSSSLCSSVEEVQIRTFDNKRAFKIISNGVAQCGKKTPYTLKPREIENKIENFINEFKNSKNDFVVNTEISENYDKLEDIKSFDNKNRLSGFEGNNRISWLSTDSSTPSAPLHSITSPTENFNSSSLASSLLSDEILKFSFHADYPQGLKSQKTFENFTKVFKSN